MVRRRARGVVHLSRLLPARPARGLPLRSRARTPGEPARRPRLARCSPSPLARRARRARFRLGIADPPGCGVEANRPGTARRAHSATAGDERRPPVPAPLLDEPARAGLGRAHAPRRPRLSPLRPLQSRLAPRAHHLPDARRAPPLPPNPGLALVRNLRRLRPDLPPLRNPSRRRQRAGRDSGLGTRDSRGTQPCHPEPFDFAQDRLREGSALVNHKSQITNHNSPLLVLPRRLRLHDAHGDDQPDVPGGRRDPLPLGPAALPVSRLLRDLFRERPLLQPRDFRPRVPCRALLGGDRPLPRFHRADPRADRRALRRPLHGLHGLPRRARALEAAAVAPDLLLR